MHMRELEALLFEGGGCLRLERIDELSERASRLLECSSRPFLGVIGFGGHVHESCGDEGAPSFLLTDGLAEDVAYVGESTLKALSRFHQRYWNVLPRFDIDLFEDEFLRKRIFLLTHFSIEIRPISHTLK